MERLHLGIMMNKELSAWFGVTDSTFKRRRKHYLEQLWAFCKFKELRGCVEIIEIYSPTYIKMNSKAYQYYIEKVPQAWRIGEVDTCSRVAAEIFIEENGIKESTGEKYVAAARDELWGSPSDYNPQCRYELAKLYRGTTKKENRYVLLTEEEKTIMSELYQEWYGTKEYTKQWIIIMDQVRNQEISKDEAFDIICNADTYRSFIAALAEKLQCDWIVRGTVVTPTIFFENK